MSESLQLHIYLIFFWFILPPCLGDRLWLSFISKQLPCHVPRIDKSDITRLPQLSSQLSIDLQLV